MLKRVQGRVEATTCEDLLEKRTRSWHSFVLTAFHKLFSLPNLFSSRLRSRTNFQLADELLEGKLLSQIQWGHILLRLIFVSVPAPQGIDVWVAEHGQRGPCDAVSVECITDFHAISPVKPLLHAILVALEQSEGLLVGNVRQSIELLRSQVLVLLEKKGLSLVVLLFAVFMNQVALLWPSCYTDLPTWRRTRTRGSRGPWIH
mmetsp:Transcript_38845/g.103131  ORF Transcript_38845/g.103131 Transcript_38845/m.103131 type:complete len:203 (+) Transcript_38845:877-1485(+)